MRKGLLEGTARNDSSELKLCACRELWLASSDLSMESIVDGGDTFLACPTTCPSFASEPLPVVTDSISR
jgi:hypothetical protein